MQTVNRYRVEGMDCASCASKIETAVRRLDGVREVSVLLTKAMLTVHHSGDGAALERTLVPLLSGLGYDAMPLDSQRAGARDLAKEDRAGQGHFTTADDVAVATAAVAVDDDHAVADNSDTDDDADGHTHGDGHGGTSGGKHAHGDHDDGDGHGHSHSLDDDDGVARPWWRKRKVRLVLYSGGALVLAYLVGLLYPAIAPVAYVVAMLVGLVPSGRRAVASAFAGSPFSIEMLMSVAAVGAVLIGAAEEAMMVIFLFLIGELLEGFTADRARASINKLVDLIPKRAFRRAQDGTFEEVAAAALAVGDVIRVRPGDRIAADGTVLDGVGSVNEAPVTGESVPKQKEAGDSVYAGTVNGETVLLVSVSATAGDNTIARIIRLVEEAQQARAPMARFIDRFARYYAPLVFAVALLTALLPPLLFGAGWSEWIYKGLALLLIGCPCALVISTPTAIAASLSAGARRGLLMKGGVVLENAGKLSLIAFDKTGTLTKGTPQVTDLLALGDAAFTAVGEDALAVHAGGKRDSSGAEAAVLAVAAALESGSAHPLALAVLERAQREGIAVVGAAGAGAIAGKGIVGKVGSADCFLGSARAAAELAVVDEAARARIDAFAAEGKTVSVLVVGGQVAGIIALRDELRPDAISGIALLHEAGIRTVMLSGDNERTAQAIAAKLGMEARAQLLPEDKQRIVAELKAQLSQGARIGVVGDGINDAPALAAADIGIAMGGGTDVALETADAALLRSGVSDVAAMVGLSRATMRNIWQNITFALGFKLIFLCTTLLGITGLWPAILADTGASVIVTINAMRLLGWKP